MVWNFEADRPIYAQLIEQIKLRIVTGLYPAGSRLPSVRDMAQEAAVNPNTMQRALSELEKEELLYSQRTSGRYITDDETRIREVKDALAREQITVFFDQMRKLGYNKEEMLTIIERAAKEVES